MSEMVEGYVKDRIKKGLLNALSIYNAVMGILLVILLWGRWWPAVISCSTLSILTFFLQLHAKKVK